MNKRWEYARIEVYKHLFDETADQWGGLGWELITVLEYGDTLTLFFKKEVE